MRDIVETTEQQTTILLTTHRRKVFLDIFVPQKQEKVLQIHLKEFILSRPAGWEPKKFNSLYFKKLRTVVFKEHIYVPVSGHKHYLTVTKEN